MLFQHHILNPANFKSIHTGFQQFHIWEIPFQTGQDRNSKMHRRDCLPRRCWKEWSCGQDLRVHQWHTSETAYGPSIKQETSQQVTPVCLCHDNSLMPSAALSTSVSLLVAVYFWSQTSDYNFLRTKDHACFENRYAGADPESYSGYSAKGQRRSRMVCVSQGSNSKRRAHSEMCKGVKMVS